MLVFLLLCASLQTLWGKPLPSPLGPSFEIAAVSDDGDQQLRSVNDIVQSCVFTIFACVWTSIHPNISGPRDCWWTCTKYRLITTLYAVIAPEIILLWALEQRFAAKEIMNQYNTEFKILEEPKTSIRAKFKELFHSHPKSTLRRGPNVRRPWTMVHGFFIQMGGFILYENELPTEALTYKRLVALIREEAIDVPTVTECELEDRSKGDTISKGLVVLQTSWFVLQCIIRGAQHLPLSELEVLTLAFAVMNAAIYIAWWSKPQGVETAICVPLKYSEKREANPVPVLTSCQKPDGHQDIIEPNEDTDEEEDGWLRRMLRKDRKNHSLPVFLLVRVPYRTFVSIFRSFWNAIKPYESGQRLRMPIFYTGNDYDTTVPGYIACTIGIIFGVIHLIGWSLEYPSSRDRMLWRISAIVLTATPSMAILVSDRGSTKVLQIITRPIFILLVPCYVVARLIVIIVAFKAIVHPPHNVLVDISWTRFIPHL